MLAIQSGIAKYHCLYLRKQWPFKRRAFFFIHQVESVWLIFKTKMLLYQAKANLDKNMLSGRITQL